MSSKTKFLLTAVMLTLTSALYAQRAYQMRLLGNWNDTALAKNPNMEGQIWNELTGWTDTASGKEYIIMGSIDSVYFFDVSNPQQIRLCDAESGLNRAINRDVEVYSHYVYCVSDNAPAGKLQIFDLSYLPDSVHKVYESAEFGYNTHSLFINKESKRLYMCINRLGTKIIGMDILSIDTPDKPSYLGTLQTSPSACQRVHEVFVKNDTAYCSCEYKGLFVYDLTDLSQQKLLGGIVPPYPYNGYNHTNWVDSSNQFIAFTDELPQGQPLKVYRIRDLNDMTYLTHFNTNPGATPHNLFWVGTTLYVSWYHDGVYMLDMTNPRLPKIKGFYDTYPQNAIGNYSGFKGCWGVYPYLPSGHIAASDMTNGLFILTYDTTVKLSAPNWLVKPEDIEVSPNPFDTYVDLHIHTYTNEPVHVKLTDIQGRTLYTTSIMITSETQRVQFPEELRAGMYVLHISNSEGTITKKMVRR
ncbi:MAG: choice-of-anchor B family protein [Bacteroidota bacterium]